MDVVWLRICCAHQGCRSISFAHFVPSLSAIRLFKAASCSTSNDPAHKDIFLCDVPKLPQFMQLVFDFFETVCHFLLKNVQALWPRWSRMCVDHCLRKSVISRVWYPSYCPSRSFFNLAFRGFLGNAFQTYSCQRSIPHHGKACSMQIRCKRLCAGFLWPGIQYTASQKEDLGLLFWHTTHLDRPKQITSYPQAIMHSRHHWSDSSSFLSTEKHGYDHTQRINQKGKTSQTPL